MLDLMPGSINRAGSWRRSRAHFKHQEGQALVEFALVALLFLTVLFAIVEFSRALWTWNTIVQATRAGARFAVVEAPAGDTLSVKNFVVYHNPAGTGSPVLPDLTRDNVTVEYLKINPSTGAYDPPLTGAVDKYNADVIQVGVTGYTFTFLVRIFGIGIPLPAFTTTLQIEGLGST